MKILLLGEIPTSLKFLKESLRGQGVQINYFSFHQLDTIELQLKESLLVVLDSSGLDSENLNLVYQLVHIVRKKQIPLLALIPQKNIRLRYRLVEIGIDDYLMLPFDKLDVQVRFKNILKYFSGNPPVPGKEDNASLNKWQSTIKVLAELNRPPGEFDYQNFLPLAIQHLQRQIGAEYVLYFESTAKSSLKLKYSMPAILTDQLLEIPVNAIPSVTTSVRLKQPTVLNQIKPQNPFQIFFKSILNIEVKAFAVYPLVVDSHTRGILLVLRTSQLKFDEMQFQTLELYANMLEAGINVQDAHTLLRQTENHKLLQFSHEFMKHILNQLNFGILVVDHQKKIKFINKPAAELFGVNTDDLRLHDLGDILGIHNLKTIFTRTGSGEGTYERPEIEIRGKRGEKILVGFNTTEFKDLQNDEIGHIITLKDITYSKELQEEMRRIDRLASLGVMASGIAHEIRNPLAGIKAIAQTFEEEMEIDDPRREYVTRIVRQVNRLDDMLKTLFSYAKPQKPNRKFHQIEETIREVLSLLKQKMQKQQIKLTQSMSANLPELFIDIGQIQQVLFNLLLNSIEAIEHQGEIHIAVEPVKSNTIKFQRKPFYKQITLNPYLLIHLSDNGSGISREDLNQIFNPFFTTKTFGTGLGLSIVYQIVKENDGIIYFESEPGNGTDCYLFLPAFAPDQINQVEKS